MTLVTHVSTSIPNPSVGPRSDVVLFKRGQVIRFNDDDTFTFQVIEIEQDQILIRDQDRMDYFFTPDVNSANHLCLRPNDDAHKWVIHLPKVNVTILDDEQAKQFESTISDRSPFWEIFAWCAIDVLSNGTRSKALHRIDDTRFPLYSLISRKATNHQGDQANQRFRVPAEIVFWAQRYKKNLESSSLIEYEQITDITRQQVIDEVAETVRQTSSLILPLSQIIAQYAVSQPTDLLLGDKKYIQKFNDKLNRQSDSPGVLQNLEST